MHFFVGMSVHSCSEKTSFQTTLEICRKRKLNVLKKIMATKSCIAAVKKLTYSRVHISLDEVFSKILKQPCPQCKNESQGLIGKKQKQNFFLIKKKIQNGWLKKACFPAPPILNIFSPKFHGLVLQLVELIDAKGIGVAQPKYMAVRLSDISSKTGNKCIFCVFRPFLSLCRTASRPHRLSHTNAFASINSTN